MPEQFRFWGRRDPRGREKPAILAAVDTPTVDADGVATLRLFDPVDSWGGDWGVSAREFTAALDAVPDAREIRLHINSPGGEVFDAIAILNALRAHPARVVAVVEGMAASAASFIAAGADELVMRPNTELMIHDAWSIAIGPAAEMHRTGDLLDRFSDNVASIYAAKAGGALEHWRGLMLDETWLSAEEAVASGLADRVDGGAQDGDPAASARFDLSAFRAAGRAAAQAPRLAPAAAAGEPAVEPAPTDLRARHAALRHRLAAARHGLVVAEAPRPYEPTPRQRALVDAYESLADTFGPFDASTGPDGAHYVAVSPFAGEGLKCSSCLMFDGARACEVVAGDIDPDGVCKLWTIPAELVTSTAPAVEPAADPVAAPGA